MSVDTHHMTDISELNVDNMTVKLQVCKGLALILYSCSVLLLYSSGIDVLCCSTECGRVVTVLQCGIVDCNSFTVWHSRG